MARTPHARLLALLFAVSASAAVLLVGCAPAVSESRTAVFQSATDALAEQIVALIPGELAPRPAPPIGEVRDGGPGAPSPTDAVWWQFEQDIQLAPEAGASVTAAESITRGLQADGWDTRRVRETERGLRVAEGFRKWVDGESWYIEMTFVRHPEPASQRIELIIVSPATVRGEPVPGD